MPAAVWGPVIFMVTGHFSGADCTYKTTEVGWFWRIHGYSMQSNYTMLHSQSWTRQMWNFMCNLLLLDLSHHADLCMRASTVQNGRFQEGFRHWIQAKFAVVVLSKVSIYAKFSLWQLRWYSHVLRATYCIKSITDFPLPGTRKKWRPRKTWSEYLKTDVGKCGIAS